MRIILLLFCIIFFITQSLAQQVKKPKWDFSVGYGLGIPVGSFNKTTPEKSVFNSPPTKYIDGFDKEGNGAAKVGKFLSFNIAYNFKDHWLLLVEGYQSINTVNTEPVLHYVNTLFDPDFTSVSNNNYRVSALALGVGYQVHYSKFNFSFAPLIGLAKISSPDYNFEWFIPIKYEVKNLSNSILLGLNSNVNYQLNPRFYIGIKMDFNLANFDYEVDRRSPGSNPSSRTDKINYQLLKTGFSIGYKI